MAELTEESAITDALIHLDGIENRPTMYSPDDYEAINVLTRWVRNEIGRHGVPAGGGPVQAVPLVGPALWYVTSGRHIDGRAVTPFMVDVSPPDPPGSPDLRRPERDILMALLRYALDQREGADARDMREARIARLSRG